MNPHLIEHKLHGGVIASNLMKGHLSIQTVSSPRYDSPRIDPLRYTPTKIILTQQQLLCYS